jgi:hypothetical protein
LTHWVKFLTPKPLRTRAITIGQQPIWQHTTKGGQQPAVPTSVCTSPFVGAAFCRPREQGTDASRRRGELRSPEHWQPRAARISNAPNHSVANAAKSSSRASLKLPATRTPLFISTRDSKIVWRKPSSDFARAFLS